MQWGASEHTGRGLHTNRGNQHKKAADRKVEDAAVAASSTNYAAEVASIQGLDVQTVREDIREGGKLIEAVGVDKALEISRSKLGTRDGIGGHALRDCSGGEVVAV